MKIIIFITGHSNKNLFSYSFPYRADEDKTEVAIKIPRPFKMYM